MLYLCTCVILRIRALARRIHFASAVRVLLLADCYYCTTGLTRMDHRPVLSHPTSLPPFHSIVPCHHIPNSAPPALLSTLTPETTGRITTATMAMMTTGLVTDFGAEERELRHVSRLLSGTRGGLEMRSKRTRVASLRGLEGA